jgi:hypothetical protein
MSIYSGFAKRNQETFYDKLIFKTIEILCKYIFYIKFGTTEINEVKFSKQILKLYKALLTLEKGKHLEPNISPALYKLAKTVYQEYKKELTGSQDRNSFNDSNGFAEALSSSQFKFSDDISNLGSEISGGFNLKQNLEVI